MIRTPHIGWSSNAYPLEADDLLRLPDAAADDFPPEALPTDAVIVGIRPDGPDALVRGRSGLSSGRTVPVRIVFRPSIPKWNLPATVVRVLRNRWRYHGTGVYHMAPSALRALHVERALRTLANPQRRGKCDRTEKMNRLAASLRERGFDDSRPVNVQVCRVGGVNDSLHQGHHRISACIELGVPRIAVRFSAAGALPAELDARRRPGATAEADALRALVERELGRAVVSFSRVAVRSHSANYRATFTDGSEALVKLAPPKAEFVPVAHALAPRDLLGGRDVRFGSRRLWVFGWLPGRAKTLDALSADEIGALAAAYASFRPALGDGRIHGDFNCNNILFDGGRVSAILDLEAVRDGNPCEDWVRYALTGAEHLPAFAVRGRRRLVANFAALAGRVGGSPADWRAAVAGFAAAKRARKARGGRLGPLTRLNLAWRARFYGRILKAVAPEGDSNV